MKRRTLLLGIGSAVAGVPLMPEAQRQNEGKRRDDHVADAERGFAGAMVRRDLEAFSAHLSDEAIFFADGKEPQVLRGKAAVIESWKKFFDGPTAPFSWDPDQVCVLDSGSLALSTGPVRDPNGTVVGRFNSIWRLESDGRWRVVFDKGCPVCR